jgi:hypothetical protein
LRHKLLPYPELDHFNHLGCRVFNDYHGVLPQKFEENITRCVIYTCLGESQNLQQIQEILEKIDAFVILPTTRRYPDIAHKTDRYEIISIPSAYAFYGKSIPEKNLVITNKKILKKILSFNHRAQWPRQALLHFFKNFDLLDQCYFSYHFEDRWNIGRLALFEQINDTIGHTWFNDAIDVGALFDSMPFVIDGDEFNDRTNGDINPISTTLGTERFYQDSFCSVVLETYIDENWDPFLTEKVFRPMAYGHPFLVHSSAGALGLLRHLGFETFPEVFDESYDEIESPQIRFEHILREIQRVCSRSLDELQDLHQNLIPKLLHNQHVLRQILPRQYEKDIAQLKSHIQQILHAV